MSFSGDLPDPGIEAGSPALAGEFFTAKPPGKPTTLVGDNLMLQNEGFIMIKVMFTSGQRCLE